MASSPSPSAQLVQSLFQAFSTGDAPGVVRLFADQAVINAVHAHDRAGGLYGAYHGRAGVEEFLANLGRTFDTQAFHVLQVIGDGDTAFAHGTFTHLVKATGKPFSSSWALRCRVHDGRIAEYHFFEDSAAYAEASR